jgi:hypothetical protein
MQERVFMVDIATSYDTDDEDLYSLPAHDPAGIFSSTRVVIELGEHVWINQDQVESLAQRWLQEEQEAETRSDEALWDAQYHFHDGSEQTVNWLLLLDALNFCFWAEKDQPRWTIDYQGEILNGYWAEAAALKRAVEEGLPLWDAKYLSTISDETIAQIFRGTQTIPLLEQRGNNAREVGQILLERFDGQFTRAIEQTNHNAVELALLLADTFPSFHDVTSYRQHEVRFFKRAQICAADLHHAFGGKEWGNLADLDKLTAFADYKLPQVLRHYNVLEYCPPLAEQIDNQELIMAGSEEEIEIRAATIWACELLRRRLSVQGHVANAAEIDQKLWLLGQNSTDMRPYHRTRTIYY